MHFFALSNCHTLVLYVLLFLLINKLLIISEYRIYFFFPMQTMVDTVKDAMLNENPRVRYKPAQFGWITWWFVYQILPEEITDCFVAYWQRNMPKPANS